MKNLAIRALIAVVCVYLIWLIVPIVLRAIGFELTSDILALFKIVIAISALYYIIWGPAPSLPPVT